MGPLTSELRKERVFLTYVLKKEKHSVETIARELGISPNIVRGYLKEIKDNPQYYEIIHQERLEENRREEEQLLEENRIAEERLIKEEEERIRKLTRNNEEIIITEVSVTFVISILPIILLWAISTTLGIISIILVFIVLTLRISDAIKKREEYEELSKTPSEDKKTTGSSKKIEKRVEELRNKKRSQIVLHYRWDDKSRKLKKIN